MTEDQTPPHRPTMGVREARSPGVQLLERIAATGEVVEEAYQGQINEWLVLGIEDLAQWAGKTERSVKSTLTRTDTTTDHRCGWEEIETGVRAYLLKDHADQLAPGPDIEIRPSALSSLRAVIAEILSAAHLWKEDPGSRVVVQGGRLKGVDLYRETAGDGPLVTVDAKYLTPTNTSEKAQNLGRYKMARQGHERFPEWLTYIGAVFGDMPIEVEYRDGKLGLTIDHTETSVRLIETERINAELVEGETTARYLWVSDEALGLAAEDPTD